MSFKTRKPPEAPQLPPQPAPVELMDIIDEISGTETVTSIMPGGKKRRETRRLPLSAKEKETLGQAENLIAKAMSNIETLYQYDPSAVVNYQPFIQTFANINQERMRDLGQIGNFADIAHKVESFRNMNRELMNREFDRQERLAEENLARRGLQRSTLAAEQRAAMAGHRALSEQQADVTAMQYGEDLANRQLAREEQIYGLRETDRQARLAEAQMAMDLERQKQADIEQKRLQAIHENMNWLNTGQAIKGAEQDRAKLALYGSQVNNQLYATQAQNQNQRYQNDVNRIKEQYAMDLNQWKSKPASFGEKLTDLGLATTGNYLGTQVSAGLNSFGGANSNSSNWVNPNYTNTTTQRMTPTYFGSSRKRVY